MNIRSLFVVYVKVFWVVLYLVCHVKCFKSVLNYVLSVCIWYMFFNIYGVCLLCDALLVLNCLTLCIDVFDSACPVSGWLMPLINGIALRL